jgi:hypothetical protein
MDADKAAEALMKYQAWLPDVPAELGMGFLYAKGSEANNLCVMIDGTQYSRLILERPLISSLRLNLPMVLAGQFIGNLKKFHEIVDAQFRIIGGSTSLAKQEVHEYDWLKALEWLAVGTGESDTFYVKSFVVKEEIPLTLVQAKSLADYAVKVGNKSEAGWFIMGDNW